MARKSLFHVERRGFDSRRLHQSFLYFQSLTITSLRQLGLQWYPVVYSKAT